MKNYILPVLIALFAFVGHVKAQTSYSMVVEKNNGDKVTIPTADIKQISFEENGASTNQDDELAVNIQNLSGIWQAISAKGTDVERRQVDTKTLSGLDSLRVPLLITLNTDMTFIAYYPRWNDLFGKYTNSPDFTWQKKGSALLPNGDGTIMLIGKQLQLTDSYGNEYAVSATIQSITSKRLVVKYTRYDENYTVTYGRDGDGVDYFSDQKQKEYSLQSLVGVWEIARIVGHENGKSYDDSGDDLTWESKRRVTIYADGSYLVEDKKRDNVTYRQRDTGTLRVSGDKIYIVESDGDKKTTLIIDLTSTRLVLFEAAEDEDYEAIHTYLRVY